MVVYVKEHRYVLRVSLVVKRCVFGPVGVAKTPPDASFGRTDMNIRGTLVALFVVMVVPAHAGGVFRDYYNRSDRSDFRADPSVIEPPSLEPDTFRRLDDSYRELGSALDKLPEIDTSSSAKAMPRQSNTCLTPRGSCGVTRSELSGTICYCDLTHSRSLVG